MIIYKNIHKALPDVIDACNEIFGIESRVSSFSNNSVAYSIENNTTVCVYQNVYRADDMVTIAIEYTGYNRIQFEQKVKTLEDLIDLQPQEVRDRFLFHLDIFR